jgi:hypothetical protein
VDFVKKTFGTGYHLRLSSRSTNPDDIQVFKSMNKEIEKLVYSFIPDAKYDPQTLETSV